MRSVNPPASQDCCVFRGFADRFLLGSPSLRLLPDAAPLFFARPPARSAAVLRCPPARSPLAGSSWTQHPLFARHPRTGPSLRPPARSATYAPAPPASSRTKRSGDAGPASRGPVGHAPRTTPHAPWLSGSGARLRLGRNDDERGWSSERGQRQRLPSHARQGRQWFPDLRPPTSSGTTSERGARPRIPAAVVPRSDCRSGSAGARRPDAGALARGRPEARSVELRKLRVRHANITSSACQRSFLTCTMIV